MTAWLAGYWQAVGEARGLLEGGSGPPQAISSEVGPGLLTRLLRACGIEWA